MGLGYSLTTGGGGNGGNAGSSNSSFGNITEDGSQQSSSFLQTAPPIAYTSAAQVAVSTNTIVLVCGAAIAGLLVYLVFKR